MFRCPRTCARPGGRPGPRRSRRPPPCGVAAGLYVILLFSLSVHFLLYSAIIASTPFLLLLLLIVIVIVIVIASVANSRQLELGTRTRTRSWL